MDRSLRLLALAALAVACNPYPGDTATATATDGTEDVGAFNGLFDGVAVGFNFPFDIGVVPDEPLTPELEGGDVFVANYGTSEILRVANPSGASGVAAEAFFDGAGAGLRGATAVSLPNHLHLWATFEQGGEGDAGGLVVLGMDGEVVSSFDAGDAAGAFANPGGICYGGVAADGSVVRFFMINLGDGTAWRIDSQTTDGVGAVFTRVGSGLATGVPGNPGTPGDGISSSSDLPQGGARGCAFAAGSLYVADAQNARVVRFDDADVDADIDGVALSDTPPDLVTFPTDVAINDEGYLIVISYDNAHAFVALEPPNGGFVDNGIHDLNVNAGNYGVALSFDTIWFTRANNQNGTLRAVTPSMETPPSTLGPFPPQ